MKEVSTSHQMSAALLAAFLTSCGGGGGGGAMTQESPNPGTGVSPTPTPGPTGNPSSGGDLVFVVNDCFGNPLPGVTIVLHGSDDISILQTKETGNDGRADFGDPGDSVVTITIVDDQQDGSSSLLEIDTVIDLPTNSYNLVAGSFEGCPRSCDNGSAYTAMFSGTPAGTDLAMLEPIFGLDFDPGDPAVFDGEICTDIVAEPFLLYATALREDSQILAYGVLENQTIKSEYSGSFDRLPASRTWQVDRAFDDLRLSMNADSDSALATLGLFEPTSAPPASGSIAFVDDVPFDLLTAAAIGTNDEISLTRESHHLFDSAPNTFQFEFMDEDFGAVSVRGSQIVWQRTTAEDADAQSATLSSASFDPETGAFNVVLWNVLTPPDRESLTFPNLPQEIEDRVGRDAIDGGEASITLAISDNSEVSGYSEYIHFGSLFQGMVFVRSAITFPRNVGETAIFNVRSVQGNSGKEILHRGRDK